MKNITYEELYKQICSKFLDELQISNMDSADKIRDIKFISAKLANIEKDFDLQRSTKIETVTRLESLKEHIINSKNNLDLEEKYILIASVNSDINKYTKEDISTENDQENCDSNQSKENINIGRHASFTKLTIFNDNVNGFVGNIKKLFIKPTSLDKSNQHLR